MTPRQLGRAQERKSRKLEFRRENSTADTGKSIGDTGREVRPRAPASASSAPLDHYAALAASASAGVLIPGENDSNYRNHLLSFYTQHRPAPGLEATVVARLADVHWRLQRLASLEAAILLLGRRKHAELFALETDPVSRQALLDAHTISVDAAPLKLLHSQENRLRRFYQQDLAELIRLQTDRTAGETIRPEPLLCPDPDELGFEFASSPDLPLPVQIAPADCLNALPFPPLQAASPSANLDRT